MNEWMPGMMEHTCNPSTKKEVEKEGFKANFGYITNLRPAYTTWDFVWKKKKRRKEILKRGWIDESVVKNTYCQGAEQMTWLKTPPAKPRDLNSSPRTHMVERENQFLQAILLPPHAMAHTEIKY